jgi:hypothetical protein
LERLWSQKSPKDFNQLWWLGLKFLAKEECKMLTWVSRHICAFNKNCLRAERTGISTLPIAITVNFTYARIKSKPLHSSYLRMFLESAFKFTQEVVGKTGYLMKTSDRVSVRDSGLVTWYDAKVIICKVFIVYLVVETTNISVWQHWRRKMVMMNSREKPLNRIFVYLKSLLYNWRETSQVMHNCVHTLQIVSTSHSPRFHPLHPKIHRFESFARFVRKERENFPVMKALKCSTFSTIEMNSIR